MTDLQKIVYLRSALKNLALSADQYIENGSWIECLTLDIEHAKEVLKSTTIKKEKTQ